MNLGKVIAVIFLGILSLTMTGCGKDGVAGNETEKRQATDLKLIVLGFHSLAERGTPPWNAQKLLENITSDPPIDFNKYEITWGVNLREVANPERTVVAYAKEVPGSGGMVAFADGLVKRVTAEQFQSLPKAEPIKMADRAADASLTAKEFSKDFYKYNGKIVELKGVVAGFSSSSDYDPPQSFNDKLLLGSEESEVLAYCVAAEPQPWAKYSKGQRVTIKGRRVVGTAIPYLQECVIVGELVPTRATTTAVALSKDCTEKGVEATKFLENKSLVLTGVVARQEGDRWSHTIVLQGNEKSKLTCKFDGKGRESTKQFKPGDPIKLYGEFKQIDGDNLILGSCQLIGE